MPAEILKCHPIIFFNTVLVGNQDALGKNALTLDANNTSFGKGFLKAYGVEFLPFLAALKSFQDDLLHGDNKALTVINKDYFIYLVENYTNPKIDGNKFYDSFVLSQDKIKQQLRKNENIVWIIGTNKERFEIRPFIGLEDGNVLISYGAIEQATQFLSIIGDSIIPVVSYQLLIQLDVSSERPLLCSSLPSTGITQLQQYYEAIRLPATHPPISFF